MADATLVSPSRDAVPEIGTVCTGDGEPLEAHVASFGDLVLGPRLAPARAELRQLAERGVSSELLVRNLLVATAHRLGDLWLDDRKAFTDVTIGLGRLQTLHNELIDDLPPLDPGSAPIRALLSAVPGETHTFGVSVAAAQLHARGWQITGSPCASSESLMNAVSCGWFEVAGLSIGSERHLEGLAQLIPKLRDASMNEALVVVASGPLAVIDEGLVAETGCDFVVADDRDARLLALETEDAQASA